MKNLRSTNKGITLIALVITIIVLLILAGVALATLTGDSGILSNAEKAKENTEKGNLKEEVSLKVIEDELDTKNEKSLEERLNQISNAEVEDIRSDTYYVTKGKSTITVYEDGKVLEGKALWDGESSASPEFKKTGDVFNWYIYTPAQLKFLADFVNQGSTVDSLDQLQKDLITKAGYNLEEVALTADSTVYLMNDLDLGAREGKVEGEAEVEESERWEKGTIYTDKADPSKNKTNEDFKWTPIGDVNEDGKKFISTFEGNGNTIRGVYVNPNSEELSSGTGLFGNTDSNSSIKNLTIENSYINGGNCTGGIVGTLNSGTVENCHNKNTTVTLRTGAYTSVGGIAGVAKGTVSNCSNTGKIVGNVIDESGNIQAGGIVGVCIATISNCYNTGEVEASGKMVGGIVGASLNSTINNCYNTGEVETSGSNVGGIVGTFSKTKIEMCYNSGNVIGKKYAGGIVGVLYGEIVKCYSKGKVEGTSYVGALIGTIQAGSTWNYLYYLNIDDENNDVMSTTEDIKTYKQFIKWIEKQVANAD